MAQAEGVAVKRLSLVLTVLACLLVIPISLADEGATPIYAPTVISQPGKYVVTRNISHDGTVIQLAASHVEIDLNGFSLTGNSTDPAILGMFVSDVRIHGGTVTGGNPGIYFEYATKIRLEGVSVLDSPGIGIQFLECAHYIVRRCMISAGAQAIHTTAAYGSPGTIEENRITESGQSVPTNEAILDNFADDFGADTLTASVKIDASWNVRVEGTSGDEIQLQGSTSCTVANNRVSVIRLDADSHANTVRRNTAGIQVEGDRNLIENNTMSGNPGYGLWFSSSAEDNLYRGNVAMGNFGTGCTGTGTADFCDEGTGNTSNGDNYMPTKM
jgi:parallel beta-helix repeat protein